MKKITILFITISLCFCLPTKALTHLRTVQEMDAIAHSVLSSKGARRIIPLKMAHPSSEILSATPLQQTESFYVYTPVSYGDRGFVIVSADDRMPAVLGYSDEADFNPQELPDGLRWLLSKYEADTRIISQLPDEVASALTGTEITPTRVDNDEPPTVAPLLGKRAWNQGTPFNNLCPKSSAWSNTVTGCVATALAQIMANHKHPEKAKGHIYYTTTTDQLDVNVDLGVETPYDWENMLDVYSFNQYNDQQAYAVAQLIYHVGAASKMDYTESSSGTYDINALLALVNNFNYDDEVNLIQAGYYSYSEWNSILQSELLAGRPVYYSGSDRTATSGHAFVFDGFDADGLYHVNWGWSGTANGYYSVTGLTPENVGIGAGLGDYSYYSAAIVGIRPNDSIADTTPSNINSSYISLGNITPGNHPRTQSISVVVPMVINNHFLYFSGELKLLLTDTDGKVVRELGTSKTFSLPTNSFQRRPSSFYTSIPSDLPDGTYRLCIGVRQNGNTAWDILRAPRNDDFSKYNYYELIMEGENYSIGTGEYPSGISHLPTASDRHVIIKKNGNGQPEISTCKPLTGYEIISPNGQIISTHSHRMEAGEQLSLPHLHTLPGIYLLRTYDLSGKSMVNKIAK